MATARLRRGTGEANRFLDCGAVAGPGWHRGWQGTQWHRVPLEIQESGRLSLGVAGDELGRVSLICGPDFDCVTVTLWARQILLASGGGFVWKESSLRSVEAEFQQLPIDFRHNPFPIFHNLRRA